MKNITETKKEEAIRKAYGEYWERLPKKIKEEVFLLDGWLDWLSLNDINLGLLWFEIRNGIDVNIDSDKDRLRPKSLQGIENNNGWIRIESEEDLPKDSRALLWVYTDHGNIYNYFFYPTCFSINELEKVVAYQPIVKPKPPIY